MKLRWLLFLMVIFSLDLTAQVSLQWREKVDEQVFSLLSEQEEIDMLVYMKVQSDIDLSDRRISKTRRGATVFNELRAVSEESQKNIRKWLIRNGSDVQSLYIVNLIKTHGNLELVRNLALRNDVHRILANPKIMMEGPVENREILDLREAEWGISAIGADKVWEMGYRGQGVVIGGQDTGYEWHHPALKTKYRGYIDSLTIDHNYNWHDAIYELNPLHKDTIVADSINPCGFQSPFPCDDHNHGTHTMGIMVGASDSLQIGVAPEAQWIGCRNMDRGYGTPFTYLECFQWFLAPTDLNNENPDPSKAPHVINNSWNCPLKEGCSVATFEVLRTAVNNLKRAGIMVVVSAGNSGPNCHTIDAPTPIYDESFTVGAIAGNDTIARFSSRGSVLVDSSRRIKPNVVAPGVSVLSSIRNNQYKKFSGTSMAGPHVAGTIALMISANPELAGYVEVIEDILEETAIPHYTNQDCGGTPGIEIPNNTYGFGFIDAVSAVEKAIVTSVQSVIKEPSYLQVFPNPASDRIQILTGEFSGKVTLHIFDLGGKRISVERITIQSEFSQSIDISYLKPGLYLFTVINNDRIGSGKFIRY